VRNYRLHLATGRTRDDIEKRIWQNDGGEKASERGRERVTKKSRGREKWTRLNDVS
ncbi:hypothetical protein TNCV_1208811, partial [Trichonephila clavipes]